MNSAEAYSIATKEVAEEEEVCQFLEYYIKHRTSKTVAIRRPGQYRSHLDRILRYESMMSLFAFAAIWIKNQKDNPELL
tara:strand:- start:756 stop:992 length:237 start_codon:yes stop_codon:yes gene_type:complete